MYNINCGEKQGKNNNVYLTNFVNIFKEKETQCHF